MLKINDLTGSHRPVDTGVVATSITAGVAALLICLLFIVIGVPWIDKPGIQTDEALFATGIYPPFGPDYPLMVMTYVGALKSYIWAAIFKLWPPSPSSVRVPAVLLGALSIWWLYHLMSRTLGTREFRCIVSALSNTSNREQQ